MHLTRSFGRVLIAAAFGLSTACHDGTEPNTPHPAPAFDARHAMSKFEPIAVVLDQPIIRSFDGTMSFFETFFRSGITLSGTLTPAAAAPLVMRVTNRLAPAVQIRADAIPNEDKGKTFVYDPNSRTYVVDANATGAPANGIRFVLYTLSEGNGPSLPLARLGYVDIAPSDEGADLTELVIVRDAPRLVVADLLVRHRADPNANVFGIDGSATDGITEDLITLVGSETGDAGQHHLVFHSTFSSSPPLVSATEELTSDQGSATEGGGLHLSYEGHTLSLLSQAQATSSTAEVSYDGNLYARIVAAASPEDQTRFLKPDGTPLSPQDAGDLNNLLLRVVSSNFFWINLAFP
ncbi:MAG TPA: hypothetical protein VJO33_00325 [Gemmatimonadaceae bacterium]|nr:hypothetical protein [Gemmatimonadaceae bacterium]